MPTRNLVPTFRHATKKLLYWLRVFLITFGLAAVAQAQTWNNKSLSASARADALVAAMTQAEQLAMVSGNPNGYIGNIPGNGRLGIPALNFQDGPAGPGDGFPGSTALPAPVCLAATWDVALARQYGTCVGQEERGKGGQVILGPTMNMARAYQNGRNSESYGEDPYLASLIAATDIQAIQSQGVIANAKHLAANDLETDRFTCTSDVDERALHEIYYMPFRACALSGVGSYMAAYNRINGVHASEGPFLNATVKKQWGFDGFIESDWAAYLGTVTAADNGLDIDMYNGAFSSTPLGNAIAAGSVPASELADKVHNILTTMFLNGVFDNPNSGNINATVTTPANQQFARDCAAAGTVLLQNKNALLPLKTNSIQSIAVLGSAASTSPISIAYGSSEVVMAYNITPLAGITSRAGAGIKVNYNQGDGGNIAAAVSLAQTSSVVVICVGQQTGESLDRTSLSLPNDQDALINAVAAVNTNTIVVTYCSSSTLMPWSTNIAAALVAWFPGQENGNALAQILFGDVNPSGRLPVTIPPNASQVPANTPAQFPGVNGHVAYSEGLNIGYRWYDANNVTPRFAFGHGLSYTTFGYSNLTVSAVSPAGQVSVGFDLTNTGTRTGAEVAQLYLGFPAAANEPPKLLKGINKVSLAPGQTKHVTFNLDWLDLANWDAIARGWLVTPGTFQVYVGASSRDLRLTNSFSVTAVPASDLANAALHQVATASSGSNFGAPVLVPTYGTNFGAAVDGNTASGWNSATSNPQTLTVDLGLMKDLSRVRLLWNTNYAAAYTIQLSTNATTWTTIYSTNAATGGLEDLLVSGRGRYVRMVGTTQGLAGTGYGVLEFEVYSQPQSPYSGSPTVLPARIEAEDFDNGGQGVAYFNSSVGNLGGAYRTNVDVGIEPCTDSGGGFDIGYINLGEWLEYTVNVPDASAIYGINLRVASGSGGGQVRVRLDGTLLGTVNIPNTGGWQNWQTVSLPNVPIAGGTGSRALRVEVINSGFNLNWIELNRVQVCNTTNFALSQPAWASSGGSANAAFDGDIRSTWTSQASDPQWLMVDLGSILNLARVQLDWQSADWNNNGYGQASYSKSFTIQLSTDGNTWTNAYTTTNGIGSRNNLAVAGNARYLRLNSTQRINGNGTALYEVEVYPGSPTLSFTNAVTNGLANFSFEYQTVADGNFLTGNPTFWRSSLLGGAIDAVINPGVVGSGQPWPSSTPSGVDGTNFCQIFANASGGGGIVYQDTGVKYQAGMTYQLTAAFGLQTYQNFATGSWMGFYNSSLAAVATKVISATNLNAGGFTDQGLNYTATGTEGGNGNIFIGFYMPPAAAAQSYFDFDNVRFVLFNQAPIITAQPVAQTALAGGPGNFSVGVYGATPLSYQWQAGPVGGPFTNLGNTGGITGATSNVLTLAGVTTNMALAYQVIVTNNYGAVTSTPPAALTVVTVPIITSQPISQSAVFGSLVSFSVGAVGPATLSYQWQAGPVGGPYTNLLNGGQITGANTNILTLTNVGPNQALAYQVIVTNSYGAVTSSPAATLNLVAATLIDVNFVTAGAPTQTGAAVLGGAGNIWNAVTGSTGTLSNSAGSIVSGVGLGVTAQGFFNDAGGSVMDAATKPLMQNYVYGYTAPTSVTVNLTGLTPYVNGPFTLVVFGAGDTSGQGVKLQITSGASGGNTASNLTTSATSRSITNGIGVAYNTFTGTLTNGTLTFTASPNGSSFTCVNGFQLQLTAQPPYITTQPSSQTNSLGNIAAFTVIAAGAGPLTYQWQANGGPGFTNLANGGNISGVTSNVLTLANLTTNSALAYQVIVANSSGSVTSSPPAILTLISSPIITNQPVSQTAIIGSTLSFSAGAAGSAPLTYQWQAGPVGGSYTNLLNGGLISGANTNLLTITGVTSNWALGYRLIVANSYGSVTSSVATFNPLTFVTPPIVPAPGAMGPALAADVRGSYSSAPANLSANIGVTAAPVTGNGDMALIVGEASSALRFYVGKADFFGVLRGSIMPVGSLKLSAPALSGSSYALNQNVGPATITGNFVNGASALSVTSWVAMAENTAVIQLNNSGSQPLALTSQLLDGLAGSAGNPGTYGSTNNSTWLNVSPDTVYLELGNQLHNAYGTAPFTGKIADFRLFTQALSGATLSALDNVGAPVPLLRWSTTNTGTATLTGSASLNPGDPRGGSVSLTGGSDEVAVGTMPMPENQFTFSTWVNVANTGVNGNIVTAQIPYPQVYGAGNPFPFPRGLTLRLVNGALSASLNQSGTFNAGSDVFTADGANKFATTAGGQIPSNQWVQTAVTYDGNVLKIFTNGVQAGVTASFPTGTNGMLGWNKLAIHTGDTNVLYNGCAPQGVLMQNILGATTTTNSQGALAFTIPAGGQVTIALAAVTDRNNPNYFAAAQQQAQAATLPSLVNLQQDHDLWWSSFWSKSYVQIPNQRIQNYWYASLYLMACCSRSNAPPPGIWGNFVTATSPAWQGDYTLNYNYESPFFGALACNHTELTDNYEQPLLEQMGRGRAAAQDIFGGNNNGIYFPIHLIASPGYSDDPFVFEDMKSASIYAAVNCSARWRYTRDTNYAAKIYPYLKGVADFWDNYLVDTGGYYVDYNDATYEYAGNDTNPTMTLSFIRHVYPSLVEISQLLNQDAGRRAKWTDIIARLTPLPIVPASSIASLNNLGAPYNAPGVNVLRNTTAGSDFDGANVKVYQDHQLRGSGAGQGSMTSIYPGWNIGLESDPYTLQAGYNTIWLMGAWYDQNADNFYYAGAASIGYNPVEILSNLDTLLSLYSYKNFMLSVGGGGIEQFATVPGTLAAMFVQSYQTNIHVFPNWPTNQSATFGNLNACGGFLVSGEITLGSANYVQIQSTAGQLLKLANPWPGAVVQCVSSLTGPSTLSGAVLNYPTQVGEVLTLTSTLVTSLPAPANLTAGLNGSSVGLSWNAVPGAAGYNVKRATTVGGPYLNIVSGLTVTNYTDATLAPQITYYYAVTALVPGFESTNSATAAVVAPLIGNGSFEAQSVTTNGYLLATPTGWNVSGQAGAAVVAVIHPGTGDNRFGAGHVPTGMDGFNYCQLFMNGGTGSATVYQDLGAANPYQAGTTYTLTAAFGLEKGSFPTGALVLYNSARVALASNVITAAMLTSNSFTSFSVNYTATGTEGNLVVGFSTTGAAAGTSFDIDNVRLTAVAAANTNALLTALTLNPAGTLSPAFAPNEFTYATTAAYGTSPTVTVVNADLTATNRLIYNGTTNLLASGVASAPLALTLGATNVVTVQVTAADGVTKQTYTVNVTELPSQTTPVLTNSVNAGTVTLSWAGDHLGYRLLMQTNHLNLGLSSNPNDWTTLPSSTTTTTTNFSITPTNAAAFYRLVYP